MNRRTGGLSGGSIGQRLVEGKTTRGRKTGGKYEEITSYRLKIEKSPRSEKKKRETKKWCYSKEHVTDAKDV